MTDTDQNQIQAEIPPEQLGFDSRFQFDCHKDVKCFTTCCRGISIMLTPYDIITMKNRLEMTSEEFLAVYTKPELLEKADLPVVILRMLDDDQQSCPFVHDREGCVIYTDRPTTCRYYPLGVGSLSYSNELDKKDEFFFMIKESHCLGFKEKKEWRVAEWREDQGVDIRDEINEGWANLIVRKKTLPPGMQLTEETKRMFFMVCYNIDKFRQFVFESTFLDRYDIDDTLITGIKEDDVALLKFGFEWLKYMLFTHKSDIIRTKETPGS